MGWLEMDIRALQFPDERFDVVIDKGTMDAMLTTKGDVWVRTNAGCLCITVAHDDGSPGDGRIKQNPPEKDVQNCRKEVEEAIR